MSREAKIGPVLLAVVGWWLMPLGLLAAAGRVNVPIQLYGGYTIVAQGSVGKLKGRNFIIDTGAVPSVVDRRLARKLGLVGKQEHLSVFSRNLMAERVTVASVELGPLRKERLEVLIEDLSAYDRPLGLRMDALIGLDVLDLSDFTIDYRAKRISFGEQVPTDSGLTAPFEIGAGYVTVRMDVRGKGVNLLVDTGTRDLILFAGRMRDRLPGIPVLEDKLVSNLGGEVRLRRAELPAAALGAAQLGTVRTYILDADGDVPDQLDGLLGVTSLAARRVGFDFKKRLMSWQR